MAGKIICEKYVLKKNKPENFNVLKQMQEVYFFLKIDHRLILRFYFLLSKNNIINTSTKPAASNAGVLVEDVG